MDPSQLALQVAQVFRSTDAHLTDLAAEAGTEPLPADFMLNHFGYVLALLCACANGNSTPLTMCTVPGLRRTARATKVVEQNLTGANPAADPLMPM